MKFILLLCCVISLGTTLPIATYAQAPAASPASSPAKKTRETTAFRGSIETVDASAKSFTIKGKKETRTFKVTAVTTLLKRGGGNASIDDLKVGEYVSGSAKKTGEMQFNAVKITVGPKDPSAAPKKKTVKKDAAPAASPSPAH